MRLAVFNEGINRRVASHLISPAQCINCVNVDTTTGILQPVKDVKDSAVSIQDYSHFFEQGNEWVDSTDIAHYQEWQEKLYFTSATDVLKVRHGGVTYNAGIESPTVVLSVTATNGPNTPTAATLTSAATGDLAATTIYKYKFVNFNLYQSEQLNITFKSGVKGRITISDVQTVDGTCFIYRLYKRKWRLLGSVTSDADTIADDVLDISANDEFVELDSMTGDYSYLYTYYDSVSDVESEPSPLSSSVSVENGSMLVTGIIASTNTRTDTIRLYRLGGNLTIYTLVTELTNVAASYTDVVKDVNLIGELLDASDNDVPLTNMKYLTQVNGVFFAAIGDKLYFTPVGKPEYWPALNFLDFEATITGIGEVINGVIVCTQLKTFLITGTTPEVFVVTTLDAKQGCVNHDTIVEYNGGLLWVSTDGIVATAGSSLDVISKRFLDDFDFTTLNAVVHNEVYYLQTTECILAIDFSNNGFVPREFDFNTDRLYVANDVLYGKVAGTRVELFASDDNSSIEYLSPRFVGNRYSEYKHYKSIYLKYTGSLDISVILDGAIEQVITLDSAKTTKEIKVPSNKQRAYSIQFKVEGIGVLEEIEWLSGGRQNGK